MVVEMSEDIIRQEGADRVTLERYLKLIEEYAPPDVQDMFKSEEPLMSPDTKKR